jgi:hypothetical protein
MPRLLRRQVPAGARSCQGRSSPRQGLRSGGTWQLPEARTGMISQIKVSALSGNPALGNEEAWLQDGDPDVYAEIAPDFPCCDGCGPGGRGGICQIK